MSGQVTYSAGWVIVSAGQSASVSRAQKNYEEKGTKWTWTDPTAEGAEPPRSVKTMTEADSLLAAACPSRFAMKYLRGDYPR